MPYLAAILAAIESLKDHEIGSSAASIRHHIQDNQKKHCKRNNPSDKEEKWNENLFQETLKSLVRQGDLLQVNGNYKFSKSYLQRRAEALEDRIDFIAEHRIKTHSAAAPPVPTVHTTAACHAIIAHSSPPVGVSSVAAVTSTALPSCRYLREEPPKESPTKKTVHSKVKINEGSIITVLNPERKKGEEEMECEEVDEGDRIVEDGMGQSHKKHVKIVPRKVGVKKMISDGDPMRT
mmetsp:Transcript_15371/g.33214  ORF Transcript_15371/g.33214 Transcript_15371/m.33214 type:complete len:236 (+) Transcript_15371:196-903(+)|eukprot:g9028.t1 g9028   contig34:670795-671631(+)